VLAFRHGSVAEVVDEGVTGYIVESEAEALTILPQVISLDRRAVRRRFEERFTAARMARDYIGVYRELLRRQERVAGEQAVPRYAEPVGGGLVAHVE
jgi:glycosyltransferase involved in cell wall biosynthesis